MKRKPNKAAMDQHYHDTELLLDKYRDIKFSLECSLLRLNQEVNLSCGSEVDKYLNRLYIAGMELTDVKLTDHARSVHLANKMLKTLEESVDFLRARHKNGEELYWLIYFTWMSPQELATIDEVIKQLQSHIKGLNSSTTYYRKRTEAIEALGRVLWGYTSRDLLPAISELLSDEE